MIRILMADDHPIVRAGFKLILHDSDDIVVTGEAENSSEVYDCLAKDEYDIVLLDIAMPGRGGIEILKQLKKERPSLPVLVLSGYPEEEFGVRSIKAGACGFLTKQSIPDKLVEAVRKVAGGSMYISESLAEMLAVRIGDEGVQLPHDILSDREYQVFCMIGSGKSVKDISEELSLSDKTISTFRARILEKMGLKNNAEITHYVVSSGLVV